MAFEQPFAQQTENAFATFDYTDAINRAGYTNLYPCAMDLSGSTTYGLVTDTSIISGHPARKKTGTGTTDTDYDILFNTAKNIRGYVYLSYATGSKGASDTFTQARLYKYDGSTETQLGSTYETKVVSTGAVITTTRNLVKFDLTGQIYTFKPGETLRLSIYMGHTGAGTGGYSQDPSASADVEEGADLQVIDTAYSTRMILAVPFVIDT